MCIGSNNMIRDISKTNLQRAVKCAPYLYAELHGFAGVRRLQELRAGRYPFGWMPSGAVSSSEFSSLHLAVNCPEIIVSAKSYPISESEYHLAHPRSGPVLTRGGIAYASFRYSSVIQSNAMRSISTRTFRGNRATSTVERAGGCTTK